MSTNVHPTTSPNPGHRLVRWFAVIGASVAACLYLLIGVGVLSVGTSTTDGATDLFAFGALMGAIYAITAVAVWRLHGRLILAAIAAFQLIPLIGYVAFAGLREPPFELWGVSIKVAQFAVLVAVAILATRAGSAGATVASTTASAAAEGRPA